MKESFPLQFANCLLKFVCHGRPILTAASPPGMPVNVIVFNSSRLCIASETPDQPRKKNSVSQNDLLHKEMGLCALTMWWYFTHFDHQNPPKYLTFCGQLRVE